MGAKRPTCKECGKVVHTDEGLYILLLIGNWFHSVVQFNGMGGWNINVQGVKEVINQKGFEVDCFPTLLRRLDVALSKMLENKKDDKEEEDK